MKIFLPTIQYPPDAGGVAKVAHEQARHLARGGDEVLVYSPHAGPEEILETEPNLNLHRPTLRARAILRLVPLILRTNNALKSFAPDFALCPTYRAMGLPVMLSATKHRVPYCIYLHGTELQTEHKSAPRRLIMRTVLDRAAFLATNSHNTRKLLEKLYPALRPSVVVVHPGVEPDRFSEAQLSPLRLSSRTNLMNRFAPVAAQEAVLMVSICRLSYQKGVDDVLRAMADLRMRHPVLPLYYVIAGEGPQEVEFKALAQSLGLNDRVLFTGPIGYDEIPPLLAAANMHVQPSRPDGDFLESFGISFLEAQAAALPCIGSDWGGVPEATARDRSTILVQPGDASELTDAIFTLATRPELRKSMGVAGRDHAARFTWAAHADLLRAEMHRHAAVAP
ncbi:hypothetical protein CVU37_08105 [candidate division BRC1 bacterium HGW-BRC1-1]|jgi:phosphatidylinositol alpha-1,6-mannosyltransferase|nr:MAG: hypothetical protein CVU37_08105 [candidate division BRC1 bacterium HGW-BRC1-1]